MESNKDEAFRCISIALRYRESGNLPSARKFCEKSLNLFPTPEASKLLENIAQLDSAESNPADPSETTSAKAHPSAPGMHHRHTRSGIEEHPSASKPARSSGAEKREYTPEQAAVVRRIRSCKVTEYYEILSLKRDCEESEVKKAYRKLALQLHPDKNGAPGADEAFKMVSKAFQILSDPDKRTVYDRSGSDPDSRFGESSASNGFARHAGMNFEGELSPEDLFNMFFGDAAFGGGGSPFGGPGVFTASFGPGGFRSTRVYSNARQAGHQPRQQGETSIRGLLTQLGPLIILFLFTFLSAVPSLFSGSSIPNPHYSFSPSTSFDIARETPNLNVKYFVNKKEFFAHPVGEESAKTAKNGGFHSPVLDRFERQVEQHYKEHIYMLCQRDQDRQQRRKEQKMGFLGIGTDWDAIRAINEEKLESCEEYKRLVIRR